jgi:hypothetical protein
MSLNTAVSEEWNPVEKRTHSRFYYAVRLGEGGAGPRTPRRDTYVILCEQRIAVCECGRTIVYRAQGVVVALCVVNCVVPKGVIKTANAVLR